MISDGDKARVSDAIRTAEAKTSGEIFCIVAHRSSDYRYVPIAWAAALALIVPMPLIYFTYWDVEIIYLMQLVTFIVAAIVLSFPPVRMHIVPRSTMRDRAHTEAMRQFLSRGLHQTKQRTGVLIFASVVERYAEIVADADINAKVTQAVWDKAIAALLDNIKNDRAADGFIAAIGICGAALAEHFPPGALDANEIPDRLVEI